MEEIKGGDHIYISVVLTNTVELKVDDRIKYITILANSFLEFNKYLLNFTDSTFLQIKLAKTLCCHPPFSENRHLEVSYKNHRKLINMLKCNS